VKNFILVKLNRFLTFQYLTGMSTTLFFLLFSLILSGSVAVIYYFSLKNQSRVTTLTREFLLKEKQLENLRVEAEKHALVADERYLIAKSEAEYLKSELVKMREDNVLLSGRLERAKGEYLALQEKLQTQKGELEEIQRNSLLSLRILQVKF
jgi:DNA recombination protein RmuC